MAITPFSNAAGWADKPRFHWERFWVPRTGLVDLSDGGFLLDPTHFGLRSSVSGAQQLSDLASYRALVLLGEPGIGKSTTLLEEAVRLRELSSDDTIVMHEDLRAYSSESLLYERVFQSSEFIDWRKGAAHLILHLDSLDEALLRIDSIANLLADEIPRLPTERLSIRIACRTAVWPSATLEIAFSRIWGKAALDVFELAPLRRRDVVAAAETNGIDADTFIRELYSASAVPFAIKPLTLNLLFALFKKEGRLPRSVAEIYFRGCLTLCEEQSLSRRDARRFGVYTSAQRLRVASRIAAASMFANRYAVWTGPEGEGVPSEDISVSTLTGRREEGDFPSFEVTEQSIRETLDTGLFTSRGDSRMGWAHQGYAEFLAAQYLSTKDLKPRNTLKLISHPSGGLVPQLNVVAAWIASISGEVRREIVQSEPLVLLQGDLTNWEDADLGQLCHSLLVAYDESRAHDLAFSTPAMYAKLNHPGLSEILRPYIVERSRNLLSRRTAILIAESCRLQALERDLLKLALDGAEDPYLRSRAVDALSACGEETILPQLLPLAKGEAGSDPDQEIKGYALQTLWPKYITISELFETITQSSDGFFGGYAEFLTKTLPGTLSREHLPVALAWATSFVQASGHGGDFHRKSLADSIFVQAWASLDDPGLIDPLLDYVLVRLRAHFELFGGSRIAGAEAFHHELDMDITRRKRFLVAAARRPLSMIDAYHLNRARLYLRKDLEWLLSSCPGGEVYDPELNPETLCNMVRVVADFDDAECFNSVYEAASRWPALWHSFRGVFEGVLIASDDARQLRETHCKLKALEQNRPPLPTTPPAVRIAQLLDMFESGDWNAWWRLNMELTLSATSTFYESDLVYSISSMAGWTEADASTRQRILRNAYKYLHIGQTSASEWVGTTHLRRNDLAAFRAMLLLKEFDTASYRAIPAHVWKKWAPAIAGIPRSHESSEEAKRQTDVVADALAAAPNEFVTAVRDVMRKERERAVGDDGHQQQTPGASFFILRQLDGCWSSDILKAGIFEELQDERNSEDQLASILNALLSARFAPARDFAIAHLGAGGPYTLTLTASLALHCAAEAWETIWRVLIEDADLGRQFFLQIAQQYSFQLPFYEHLTEDQLAELYLFLEQMFPRNADPERRAGEARWVGPRDSLVYLRDGIPQQIANRGTAAAVTAMQWLVAKLPEQHWLSFRLLEAQRVMRLKTWSPLTPKELFGLIASKDRVLVRSADDLCELLVETLRNFERELHSEQNPVRSLWDRQAGGATFRPIEEDGFSDAVRLFLRRELVEKGIIANREVEVARVPGAPIGRRTDIRIDALRHSPDSGVFDNITAVIESKGCWNSALFDALKDQLYADYMVTLRAPVGIYLVAWFDKLKWDSEDRRRGQTPELTIPEVQARLDYEANSIPQGYFVRAVVIDCHAP